MKHFTDLFQNEKRIGLPAVAIMSGAFLVGSAPLALANPLVSMAPPIYATGYQVTQGGPADISPDNVFDWNQVPENEHVPITRAIFDRGGYQLYDTDGETITVPFTNDNLYVMQFARTDNDQMYFVNRDGNVPILYVPEGGYLENATVAGARWYPFSGDFHPSNPVYLGIAPSWSAFIGMGWYPDMYWRGGYWSGHSFLSGGIFLPSIGLFLSIGGHDYYGWGGYRDYYHSHPDYHIPALFHRHVYDFARRPVSSFHRFRGAGLNLSTHDEIHSGRGLTGHNAFHGYSGHNTFHTTTGHDAIHATTGHTFQGAQHSSRADHSFGGGQHSFRGNDQHGAAQHAFQGGQQHGGSGQHSFNGTQQGSHTGGRHGDQGANNDHGSGGGDHGNGGGGGGWHGH